MSTIDIGNKLEDCFFEYLQAQKSNGALVNDAHPPQLCEIFKKKKYFCCERKADIEFDVVIELTREGKSTPYQFIVFECKNHTSSVQERDVRDFSDKISNVFGHAGKGIVVVSSQLQSGAENIARSRNIGIVKYDKHGFEAVAERNGGVRAENRYIRFQLFAPERFMKPLIFSAYFDGRFFSSIDIFLCSLDTKARKESYINSDKNFHSIPFIPPKQLRVEANSALAQVKYSSGPVDLIEVCKKNKIGLRYSDDLVESYNGEAVLGSANFATRTIQINPHGNRHRERFTLAHEIGHFLLGHGKFLLSESVAERDLVASNEENDAFNYERLEIQANTFAAELILPEKEFRLVVAAARFKLDITDRGHGYIYVDDQPCNLKPYYQLLSFLSSYFEVSGQVVEIRLLRLGLMNDNRKRRLSESSIKNSSLLSLRVEQAN